MWRRALLAAAAVSYLICVLIMSGMQKEDLDVSMLQKLQRYNVNFDDINNERIRQQCLSRNNDFTTGDQKQLKEGYVSTTEYKSTLTTKEPLPPVTMNMDTVINYLKAREDKVTYSDETTTAKPTRTEEIVTHPAEHIDNQPKIDLDLLRQYIQLETEEKTFYKLDGNSKTNKDYTSIKLKTNEKYSNDVEFINKQIKDYLSKQQTIPTTKYTTPRYTIDIQSIYKQIDEIIANRSNIDNEEDKIVKKYPNKDGQSNTNYNVIRPVDIMPLSQKISYPTDKRLFESFYNFLNNMNQFRNNSFQPFSINDNVYSDKPQTQNNQNNQENYKATTTHKLKSEMELNQQSLTPHLVKEIADTVKKVIIKDLRNELASIYLKATQVTSTTTIITAETTTEISTTTSNSKTQNNVAIIDKFMELYEQIKSLKQPSFLLRANNDSATYVINNHNQPIKDPVKSEMFMPLVNGQIREKKISIPSVANYNTNPFLNYNSYLPRKENNHRLPITIQTNSVEIQPLAIPISQHESLIRQNIIVNPGYRFQSRIGRHRNINPRGNRYSDSDVPIKHTNRTYNYSPLKQYDRYNSVRYPPYRFQDPKQRDDIIRFRLRDNGNSRLDTDYYEKINFGNEHNSVKEKQGIFNNRNIARFHERLERVDTGSDGIPVVSDTDVTGKQEQNGDFPSRHQLSLVDMKKGSSYDDTHFKNFLKTQQKVTDVLERILATRPKTNTPRSVEAV